MVKVKMLQDGILSCEDRLDEKINNFIKGKKLIDIQFASIGSGNRATALISYIEDDEVVTDGKWQKRF